jgi:hypothetical protein
MTRTLPSATSWWSYTRRFQGTCTTDFRFADCFCAYPSTTTSTTPAATSTSTTLVCTGSRGGEELRDFRDPTIDSNCCLKHL